MASNVCLRLLCLPFGLFGSGSGIPSSECEHECRIFFPFLRRNHSPPATEFPAVQILLLCQSDKWFLPDRSFCFSVSPPRFCFSLDVCFLYFSHSERKWNRHIGRCNTSAPLFQKKNPVRHLHYGYRKLWFHNNSPNKYFFWLALHQCVHCFPNQTYGHYALDCKHHFYRNDHCVVSTSKAFPPFLFECCQGNRNSSAAVLLHLCAGNTQY